MFDMLICYGEFCRLILDIVLRRRYGNFVSILSYLIINGSKLNLRAELKTLVGKTWKNSVRGFGYGKPLHAV